MVLVGDNGPEISVRLDGYHGIHNSHGRPGSVRGFERHSPSIISAGFGIRGTRVYLQVLYNTMNANSYNMDRSIGGVGMMDDQDGNGMGAQDTKI